VFGGFLSAGSGCVSYTHSVNLLCVIQHQLQSVCCVTTLELISLNMAELVSFDSSVQTVIVYISFDLLFVRGVPLSLRVIMNGWQLILSVQ